MPYTTPTVNYCATINGTYTSLTGVQSVSIRRGRQRFQDNLPQTSCVIDLIPAATYAVPFAIGQFVDIRDTNSASSPCYFFGVITDIERKYAIPYNTVSGLAPADRIVLTVTGPVGALGKTSFAAFTLANTSTSSALFGAAFSNGIYVGNQIGSGVKCSAQSYTGGALDLANELLRTGQAIMDDIDNKRNSYVSFSFVINQYPPGQGNVNYTFSDAGTVSAFKFSNLEFLSSVQNVFTEVQVAPTGLATQSATSGSAPYNTLVYNTLNESTGDAANLASYILATQSLATVTPYSITTNTNTAPTCTTISQLSTTAIYDIGTSKAMNLGSSVTVIFRGTTFTATIQGINTTFYPDYATVQLFLSPTLGTPFTLDSTELGVLNTNRLGFP